MNKVVHFEIPANDPGKCINFFKEVFGWNFQQYGTEEYWFAITGDEKAPGINGAVMKRRDPNQPIVNSIGVASIDDSMKKVEKAGGTIVVPKMAIPSVGWLCYFKDPDGNIHGIWEENANAK